MPQKITAFFQMHRKQLCAVAVVLALGAVYYLLIWLTPFRIPCLFQKLTSLACPGCGVTHMCIRLVQLDFIGAARENLAIACLVPIWILWLGVRSCLHPAWMRKNGKAERIFLIGCIVLLVGFGIARNLPGLEFLLPSYLR